MGYATNGNHSLTSNAIHKVLALLRQEAEAEPPPIAREVLKVGEAIALATYASLRGPKLLLLDLAGLRWNIDKGKNGSLPQSPLKVGIDLTEAPHVIAVLLGNFKGKTGCSTPHDSLSQHDNIRHSSQVVIGGVNQHPGRRGLFPWTSLRLCQRIGGYLARI